MESTTTAKAPTSVLRKYLLLLATVVATVTYAAGFSPPGGLWQETDPAGDHLAGDPIIRATHNQRYQAFFYCNATAFASSLMVIVLNLILGARENGGELDNPRTTTMLLAVMVVDLLSLMGAYAAGACRDTFTTVYSLLLVLAVLLFLSYQMRRSPNDGDSSDDQAEKRFRKVLMLLATFAVSVTYVAGLSTPGGFWDNADGGHQPGDAVLSDHHQGRLTAFFACSNTAFVASLLIIMVLLDSRHQAKTASWVALVVMMCLVGAYAAGSCRQVGTTVYVFCLLAAVLAYILVHAAVLAYWQKKRRPQTADAPEGAHQTPPTQDSLQGADQTQDLPKGARCCSSLFALAAWATSNTPELKEETERAKSLVMLLATLAATITYQAGLQPPGGLWPDNGDGHNAGDPVLESLDPRRYKFFFYCNSVAFVASLVAVLLVQHKSMHRHHVLEAAMVLDLFGLIGAYASGSCRDVSNSIYVVAVAGAVLVYVVIHVVFVTLDHTDNLDERAVENVEKRRKRMLLFAIVAATITYQAGLTPPGGFQVDGDPALLLSSPGRYKAFFYCNTVSFMLSMALIILLVNPHLYRPAIRSYALSVCTAAGLFGVLGAYAAGSTQHLKSSIYIFVLVCLVFLVVLLLVRFVNRKKSGAISRQDRRKGDTEIDIKNRRLHGKRKYLMLLGILVASVTYQAGLAPPGGVWPSSTDGHDAGNPVMHDDTRHRYLAFFYSNSISFVASVVVIVLLMPASGQSAQWLKVMKVPVMLDLLGLLVAYAVGTTTDWKRTAYVVALLFAVLAYIAVHVILSCWRMERGRNRAASVVHSHSEEDESQGQVAPV